MIEKNYTLKTTKISEDETFTKMDVSKSRLKELNLRSLFKSNYNRYFGIGKDEKGFYIRELKDYDKGYFIIPRKRRAIIVDLPEEIWKHIPGTPDCNYVSNMGRFKLVDQDGNERFGSVITSTNKTKKKYYDILIKKPNDRGYRVRLSRALAKTFIDENFPLIYSNGDRVVVDHIDNNSENNKVDNLRIVSSSDNILAAIYQQNRVVGRAKRECYAYNINTGEIRKYISTALLSQDIFNSTNRGWFSNYNKNKLKTASGWIVGYNKDELIATGEFLK